MPDPVALTSRIHAAFAEVPYPGDWCLRGSGEGEEPFLLEQDFKGKRDWRTIEPNFLDQAPDGFGSALSFFSDEAFRFYLPGYLIADIDGHLEMADPVFHLTHGLTDSGKTEHVNPPRYGERTWFETSRQRMAVFDRAQAAAIVDYLRFKRKTSDEQREIDQALRNFWVDRALRS